jgi:error-prone DNA polymerase
MGFTHLRAYSGYSTKFGASLPDVLAERAAERGLDALAVTDRDTVAGVVRFAKACARVGVRPLFGADLAVPEYLDPVAAVVGERRRSPVRGGTFVDESAPRVRFLARNRKGWAAVCRLITAAHADPDAKPALAWPDLQHAAGGDVYVLLGPESEPVRALAAGRPDRAGKLLEPWLDVVGVRLRLEVVHHGRPGTAPGSVRLAARTLALAAEHGIPAVLTNAVRYADPGMGEVADVLDAARLLVPVDPRKPDHLDSGEGWLKDEGDMIRAAQQIADAAGAGCAGARALLAQTARVAADCRVDPREDLGIGKIHFPEPVTVGATGRRTPDVLLQARCNAAMFARGYAHDPVRWERLRAELKTIKTLGFATYFLTVADVVADARAAGIRVSARGSGAGSFVVHLLGIAVADPVEQGLLMERFLSTRRVEMPDIDIDVESARRLEVYRMIMDRFGAARTATLAMPETYRVRHAVRDVGAALGMDPDVTDRLAKAFPHIRARDAKAALTELPELRDIALEEHGRFWDLVESLDGLIRGYAMHPCGVIISDAGLLDRTPVVPTAQEGFPMSQFDKEDVEDVGLLKLDVLGVRMLSAMAHALDEVERVSGQRLDLDRIPDGDPATYDLIRSAETLGCFQIESPGQRDLVARLQPSTFADLVVDISLFRPGPVQADMVRPFINRRHGCEQAAYPHPDLKPALEQTYGVVVFHEQLIEILATMTGCDRAEADEARRALSKEDKVGQLRAWFGDRARERGYSTDTVRRTWDVIAAFGSYGFCKAHACAFAVPTYQSAWLKAHRPAAFYAGLLTHDPGMYPKRSILADARRRGIPVLPVDVNHSKVDYKVEEAPGRIWGLRLALADVQGIHDSEAERIAAGAPYTSLPDFWQRARPSRPTAERLINIGALDTVTGRANRRDLVLQLTELHRAERAAGTDGQLPLLDAENTETAPTGLPDMDRAQKLRAELAVLGMEASSGHVIAEYAGLLEDLGVTPAKMLPTARHGSSVLVAGIKVATSTPPVRSGRRVIFLTLEDTTGLADLAFFEDSHAACAHTVFHNGLLLVRGTVQRRSKQSTTLVGTAAWPLDELDRLRRDGGLDAVAARLADRPLPATNTQDSGEGAEPAADDTKATPAAQQLGRSIHLETGYDLHPWADLQPPGQRAATGRTLWHASPGSAG